MGGRAGGRVGWLVGCLISGFVRKKLLVADQTAAIIDTDSTQDTLVTSFPVTYMTYSCLL